MGQFAHLREYPTAALTDVTAPNADTLYSLAWLDVSEGPLVLHVPDEHGRYYLMPMLNGWTGVLAAPGTRTTGTGAGDFGIAGPGWSGNLPPGVELLRSSTNMAPGEWQGFARNDPARAARGMESPAQPPRSRRSADRVQRGPPASAYPDSLRQDDAVTLHLLPWLRRPDSRRSRDDACIGTSRAGVW
jgi:hypothetical protein